MKHTLGKKHKENEVAASGCQLLLTFSTQQPRREDAQAALLMAYFLVEHNLPIVIAEHIPQPISILHIPADANTFWLAIRAPSRDVTFN